MPKTLAQNRDRSASVSGLTGSVYLTAQAAVQENQLSTFSKYLGGLSIECAENISFATFIRRPGNESLEEIVEQACKFLSEAPSLVSGSGDPLSLMKNHIVQQLLGNLKLHCELKSRGLLEAESALLKDRHKTKDGTQALCLEVLSALSMSKPDNGVDRLLQAEWSKQQKERLASANNAARLRATNASGSGQGLMLKTPS
jgi:hypothetical protein